MGTFGTGNRAVVPGMGEIMTNHVNLLPMRYRQGQMIRRRIGQWCAVWALAATALTLTGWTHWSTYRADVLKLESLTREFAPIDQMSREIDAITDRIDQLEQRESLVLELAAEESMLSLMGILSTAAGDCGGAICIQRCQLQRRDSGEQTLKVLTLDGIGEDNLAVARFAAALRDAAPFRRVELKSTGLGAPTRVESRTYSLECVF